MAQAGIQTRSRMPIPLKMPSPVREAWGDAATDAFTDWMEVTVLPHMVPRDEYREITSRMDVLESRMGGLEGRMDGLERAVMQNRVELHQRLDGLRAELKEEQNGLRAEIKEEMGGSRAEIKEEMSGLRTEFKSELHEHWRETRIAIDELRQEMREDSQTTHAQLDAMTDRLLIQTRWMIGSLTVIGALVTLLLTVGMFVK